MPGRQPVTTLPAIQSEAVNDVRSTAGSRASPTTSPRPSTTKAIGPPVPSYTYFQDQVSVRKPPLLKFDHRNHVLNLAEVLTEVLLKHCQPCVEYPAHQRRSVRNALTGQQSASDLRPVRIGRHDNEKERLFELATKG